MAVPFRLGIVLLTLCADSLAADDPVYAPLPETKARHAGSAVTEFLWVRQP